MLRRGSDVGFIPLSSQTSANRSGASFPTRCTRGFLLLRWGIYSQGMNPFFDLVSLSLVALWQRKDSSRVGSLTYEARMSDAFASYEKKYCEVKRALSESRGTSVSEPLFLSKEGRRSNPEVDEKRVQRNEPSDVFFVPRSLRVQLANSISRDVDVCAALSGGIDASEDSSEISSSPGRDPFADDVPSLRFSNRKMREGRRPTKSTSKSPRPRHSFEGWT